MKIIFGVFISVFIFLSSCKEETKNETVTPIHNASLKITVLKENTSHIKHPLSGVTVYLFLTDNDRTQNQNVKYSGTVNDSGKISFNKLPDDYYFIFSSHSTYGTQKTETSTPNNSVSFEVIYY